MPSVVTMSWPTFSASEQLGGIEHDTLVRQLDPAAVVASWTIGLTPVAVTSGEVSTCAIRPIAGAPSAPASEP